MVVVIIISMGTLPIIFFFILEIRKETKTPSIFLLTINYTKTMLLYISLIFMLGYIPSILKGVHIKEKKDECKLNIYFQQKCNTESHI